MEAKIKDFNEKLRVVQEFLDNHQQKYMLVGSGALLSCGVPLPRCYNDVDLEVIETEENAKLFQTLQDATTTLNNEYSGKKMNGKELPFTFTYKNVKVNIWLVEAFSHEQWVWKNNVKIATVYSVLKKKMSYKRDKDKEDLLSIIKTLSSIHEK
jgi:hypothetical protein